MLSEVKSDLIVQTIDQVAEEQDFCGLVSLIESVTYRLGSVGVDVDTDQVLDVYNRLFEEDI
jgi:hypothetical protein